VAREYREMDRVLPIIFQKSGYDRNRLK